MATEQQVAEALEMVECARINLVNMVKMMPALAHHPLLPLVTMQLDDAVEALEGGATQEGEG